jgi:hypothetical protein
MRLEIERNPPRTGRKAEIDQNNQVETNSPSDHRPGSIVLEPLTTR